MVADVDAFLAEMVPRQIAADPATCNGDVEPRLATWSHRDPVSLSAALSG